MTFKITSNRIKYLVTNLIKEVKDSENCKILMKEIEDEKMDRNRSCVHKMQGLI